MAKGKKKAQGNADGRGVLSDLTVGIVGQAAGQILAEGIQRLTPSMLGGGGGGPDLLGRLLLHLAEQGPTTIAQLLEHTASESMELLDALTAARRGRLVRRLDKMAVVQLTEAGCAGAQVLRQRQEKQVLGPSEAGGRGAG